MLDLSSRESTGSRPWAGFIKAGERSCDLKSVLSVSSSSLSPMTMQLLDSIQRLVNSIPATIADVADFAYFKHVIIVSFVHRSKQTNIHIEIKEMEGGVRATSILCLLGIGLGLGSVLLYKICSRIFSPAIEKPKSKKRPSSPSATGDGRFPDKTSCDKLSPETPDSGIDTTIYLTNQHSQCSSAVITPNSPHEEGRGELYCSAQGLHHRDRGSHCEHAINNEQFSDHVSFPLTRGQSQTFEYSTSDTRDQYSPANSCLSSYETRPDTRGLHRRPLFSSTASTDQGFISHNFTASGAFSTPSREDLSLSRIASEKESFSRHSLPADASPIGHTTPLRGGSAPPDQLLAHRSSGSSGSPTSMHRQHGENGLLAPTKKKKVPTATLR